MATTNLWTGWIWCNGHTATLINIVVQLGLAIIPLCKAAASGLTSGTTRGTWGSIRKALELSITTAPASTAFFAHTFDVDPPADASTKSTFLNESFVTASTCKLCSLNFKVLPTELGDASSLNSATGKFRVSSNSSNSVPTAPVAPNIATLYESDKSFYSFRFNFQ